MEDFEKLGAFYLGKRFDHQKEVVTDDLLLYDARDLTTHGVCVGMTGSGKTGLCLSLLEEAAIDRIPAIAIDPKGDLGNLMLSFPGLAPADFRPWVDEGEAARKGQTPDQYARSIAQLWKKGLGDWGQNGERIARFRQTADVAIYTPGSNAGLELTVLKSFAAPPPAVLDDSDLFRERIAASASGLLGLLGIDADPIQSREHILLSNILQHAWQQGQDLDIAALIQQIQSPPIQKIGVMDLESIYPGKDRFALSMRLNNLLASPGFSGWMSGEALDIQRLLWTPEGKPRLTILSIAHLSEPERMFFVTLLLGELLAWMRSQPGTTSLRAMLYMDEVFGYLPPIGNPPSKKPLLTLLKQARAFGLGVMLATQNPVDLDYKGLSNMGTWFLGRLQTERDQARVLDGLEGASSATGASFDRRQLEATLAGLRSRVFLMHNVHDNAPVLFHTRWALSYLRGPLTRSQIRTLMQERKAAAEDAESAEPAAKKASKKTKGKAKAVEASPRPALPPGITERFLPTAKEPAEGSRLLYRPHLLGTARLHFARATDHVDLWQTVTLLAPLDDDSVREPWEEASALEGKPDLSSAGRDEAEFASLPAAAANAKTYPKWEKALSTYLYRTRSIDIWKSTSPKATSTPGQSEGDFRAHLVQLAREKRDLDRAKLEKKYLPKLARQEERIQKAEAKVEEQAEQHGRARMQAAIQMGTTLLGAVFGRRTRSGNISRAGTAARAFSRAGKEKGDIARAEDLLQVERQKLEELEAEFKEVLANLDEPIGADDLTLVHKPLRPRKTDTSIAQLALVWVPWEVDADGIAEPLASWAEE